MQRLLCEGTNRCNRVTWHKCPKAPNPSSLNTPKTGPKGKCPKAPNPSSLNTPKTGPKGKCPKATNPSSLNTRKTGPKGKCPKATSPSSLNTRKTGPKGKCLVRTEPNLNTGRASANTSHGQSSFRASHLMRIELSLDRSLMMSGLLTIPPLLVSTHPAVSVRSIV
jgi:hypothetical protein